MFYFIIISSSHIALSSIDGLTSVVDKITPHGKKKSVKLKLPTPYKN